MAATQSRYGFSNSTGEAKKEDKTSQHGTVKYRKLKDLGTRGLFQMITLSNYREVNIKIYIPRTILISSFFSIKHKVTFLLLLQNIHMPL